MILQSLKSIHNFLVFLFTMSSLFSLDSVLLYVTISATSVASQSTTTIPIDDSKGWSVAGIVTMITFNILAMIVIILSLIHFAYSLYTVKNRFPTNKILVTFQIILSIFAIISCFTYGFFRSNIFISDIHSPSSCFLIYCFSLFGWAFSRTLCLLSFIGRIYLSFKGSVLGMIICTISLS